jgi:hypothetical protein
MADPPTTLIQINTSNTRSALAADGMDWVIGECVWYREGSSFAFRVGRAAAANDVRAVRRFPVIDHDMPGCADHWLAAATNKGCVRIDDREDGWTGARLCGYRGNGGDAPLIDGVSPATVGPGFPD